MIAVSRVVWFLVRLARRMCCRVDSDFSGGASWLISWMCEHMTDDSGDDASCPALTYGNDISKGR